jgi:hypothetical protein
VAQDGTRAVAGMLTDAKRSGSQFNLHAPVKVQYFFAALYCQRLSFSCENTAACLIRLRAKQIPFAYYFGHARHRFVVLGLSEIVCNG